MGLEKVELLIHPSCGGAIKAMTVNGRPASFSYARSAWDSVEGLPLKLRPPFTPVILIVSGLGLGDMHDDEN